MIRCTEQLHYGNVIAHSARCAVHFSARLGKFLIAPLTRSRARSRRERERERAPLPPSRVAAHVLCTHAHSYFTLIDALCADTPLARLDRLSSPRNFGSVRIRENATNDDDERERDGSERIRLHVQRRGVTRNRVNAKDVAAASEIFHHKAWRKRERRAAWRRRTAQREDLPFASPWPQQQRYALQMDSHSTGRNIRSRDFSIAKTERVQRPGRRSPFRNIYRDR